MEISMKTRLPNSSEATCIKKRQPLKLLQDLQAFQRSVMSKVNFRSSSPKTVSSRQKKAETFPQTKDCLIKYKTPNNSASQTIAKKQVNAKSNVPEQKKLDMPGEITLKTPESSDGSATSVGSLTSSPKWAHIKNKFESVESSGKTALSRSSSLNKDSNDFSLSKSSSSKSLPSAMSEKNFSLCKNKNSSSKNGGLKKTDSVVTKFDSSSSKANSVQTKSNLQKDKSNSKTSSNRNSQSHTLTANHSALHSGRSKNTHSTSSYGSSSSLVSNGSARSSPTNIPSSSASYLHSRKSSKNTQLSNSSISSSFPHLDNLSKSSSSELSACSVNSGKNSHTNSAITNPSSVQSSTVRKNTQVHKVGTRTKETHEDKPILTFNKHNHQPADKTEKRFLNKVSKNISETDKALLSNALDASQTKSSVLSNKRHSTIISNNSFNKAVTDQNIENIKNLARKSQTASKTVWVKDSAGNWIKRADQVSKDSNNSKVASLRSKFSECNKNSVPLSKSSTSSNVLKYPQSSRPLAKSSTTSSICDKIFAGNTCGAKENTNSSTDSKVRYDQTVPDSKLKVGNLNNADQNSDANSKLSIVQRAVLSYEGNLALLSPESQRRLKLIGDKVRAQTDDDKLLQVKAKTGAVSGISQNANGVTKAVSSGPNKLAKGTSSNKLGEPILPVRNFLNRYQQSNKSNNSKNMRKSLYSETSDTCKQVETKPKLSSSTGKVNLLHHKENISICPKSKRETSVPKCTSEVKTSIENNSTVLKNSANNSEKIDASHQKQKANDILQPNASFLWRKSEVSSSELSKSSTTSSVSLTSSDYKNYYEVENYYSSLEVEIEKGSEMSDDHIYIDSQGSSSSGNNYASYSTPYQNLPNGTKNTFRDEWTDISDDDYMKSSVSSNQNSTLKRKKMKRYPSRKESQQSSDRDEVFNAGKQTMTDTISFTDSSDTLINSEVGNESTCDVSEIQHLYEPVYESLGNYLKKEACQDEDNCSISLSPDDRDNTDFMQCSLTSLESAESLNQEKEETQKVTNVPDSTNAANKKTGNKISQLKRHLSWTKNDIRLELSSKFNKIKIKKNGQNSTEIGVKVQEHDSNNTSPKKKTFIKCILRQKSASSIPVKRSPSPKKESAHFYVHLSMAREKQRPFSDSAVVDEIIAGKERGKSMQNFRKQSEPALPLTDAAVKTQCHFKGRKFSSGPIVQRPKTPPPLPPIQSCVNNKSTESKFESNIYESSYETCDSVNSQFYTVLDEDFISSVNAASRSRYENDILAKIHSTANTRNGISSSNDSLPSSISTRKSDDNSTPRPSESLNLCLLQNFQADLLKSPFEEEPMYQFYQKDVQQRATLWYSADGSESEFDDDSSSKLSDPDYHAVRPPVLQSQMSAMDLVHGEGGQRTLWCEVPEVVTSGILKSISSNERKIQEAMFEVITSEASYLKSLNFLMDHFVQCKEFSGNFSEKHVLDKRERHVLFSDIQPVRDVSASLLADLEKRWLENIILSNICDIIYQHASKYFSVYVKYCSNQLYQERTLKELKEKRPEFLAVLKRLESNPICQGLDMHSFLMLPMQRITRLPLLIDAIFHRLSVESSIYESCKMALATLNKLVAECNEGARKMERMEEMLVISQQIDFKECKGFGLLSASRWLVKRGELIQLLMDSSSRRTFGRNSRWCKIQLYLFLFTDLLVVTRKKSDDSYLVVDYCPRNMLQVKLLDENMPPLPMRLPSSYRNVFQLIMLNNREGKTVEMLLSCLLESDRTRWMNAVTPAKSDNPDEKIYEEWDCPQVQCTHAYNAQQPDELSLEEADVVNVFKKMSDGWYEGERIRDGVRGWFPSSHTVEIINSHVRARNLHQRYRLLMLSQTYLEEQYKAQAAQTKK